MARPKKKIDYSMVEKLSYIHCTQDEIASVLDVSTRTLQRDKEFCRLYKKGLDKGRMSLRRYQFQKAEEGNVTMLIWLGKQFLKQADKTDLNTQNNSKIDVKSTISPEKLSQEDVETLAEEIRKKRNEELENM